MIGWTGDRKEQHLDAPIYSTQQLDANDTVFFGSTVGSEEGHYHKTNMHVPHVLPHGVELRVRYLRFYSDPTTLKFLQRTAFMIVRIIDRDMLILPCRILDVGEGYLSRQFRVPLILGAEQSFMVILRMNEQTKRKSLVTAIFEGMMIRPL
jgi:hypothetical protein